MKYNIWSFIWDLSELTGIGLGKFAPFIFGKRNGNTGEKIN